MRHLILGFFLIAIFCRCENVDETTSAKSVPVNDVSQLTGKWVLVESSYSIGDGKQHWTSVKNGYSYDFNEDGTFASDRFNACSGVKYSLSEGNLILEFNCDGEIIGYTENVFMSDGNLYLSPIAPSICIEGCSFRFERND